MGHQALQGGQIGILGLLERLLDHQSLALHAGIVAVHQTEPSISDCLNAVQMIQTGAL